MIKYFFYFISKKEKIEKKRFSVDFRNFNQKLISQLTYKLTA